MTTLLLSAIITISLALVFYTIGVWSERRAGVLRIGHLLFFGLGLVFDTTGTLLMGKIAAQKVIDNLQMYRLHQATGMLAIFLMLIHFIWALYVLINGSKEAKLNFHKFSIIVWAFWLIPYFVGLIIGMFG